MTRLDNQIAEERIVDLRTSLLGHHFWKNHRNEVGLMSGFLAAIVITDRAWISAMRPVLERSEDYALDRERFDASIPRVRRDELIVGAVGARGTPYYGLAGVVDRSITLGHVSPDAWRAYISAVLAANCDRELLDIIARAWCYRDDLIDDNLSLAFDAALEIRQRSAAYGLFAKSGYVPLL